MRLLTSLLAVLLLCLLLPAFALGEDTDILTPLDMKPDTEGQILDLYCGPTQGFYRHGEQNLDTGKPYVLFGQYDCWAMAAQGTAADFGPVGWVEAGSITDIPYEPQLSFENGFAATVEEAAPMTDHPFSESPFDGWTARLEPGTQITVLAQLGDWLYVQAEIGGVPVRAFIRTDAVY
ncbi:MAG: hypothetical protein IKU38_04810 [Clostridia bacterium]|nr:hypothetical protein [Clostridia bacterium]